MSADASLVLAGVAVEIAAIYPGTALYVVKRPVTGNKPPNGGFNPAWTLPCFVLSANEPEGIDDDGDFEEVSVKYPVMVEYLKAASVVTGTGTDPLYLEDSAVRDVRQAVRQRLYKPRLTTLPTTMFNVMMRPGKVYEMTGAGALQVIVSPQTFIFEVMEPRAE